MIRSRPFFVRIKICPCYLLKHALNSSICKIASSIPSMCYHFCLRHSILAKMDCAKWLAVQFFFLFWLFHILLVMGLISCSKLSVFKFSKKIQPNIFSFPQIHICRIFHQNFVILGYLVLKSLKIKTYLQGPRNRFYLGEAQNFFTKYQHFTLQKFLRPVPRCLVISNFVLTF